MAKDKQTKAEQGSKDKKDKPDKPDKPDKRGQADEAAWEATRKIARKIRKDDKDKQWSKLPWREIRGQLRESGDTVDMTKVPVTWNTESPQMIKIRTILEKAGFKKDGHLYRWEPAAAAEPE